MSRVEAMPDNAGDKWMAIQKASVRVSSGEDASSVENSPTHRNQRSREKEVEKQRG